MTFKGKRYKAKPATKCILFVIMIAGAGIVEGSSGWSGVLIGAAVSLGSAYTLLKLG